MDRVIVLKKTLLSSILYKCVSGLVVFFFFFSSRRRHTRFDCDWSSDVCSSDLVHSPLGAGVGRGLPLGTSPRQSWTLRYVSLLELRRHENVFFGLGQRAMKRDRKSVV